MDNYKSKNEFYSDPFPLNAELFDAFLSIEQYTLNVKKKNIDGEEEISDSVALYNIVITKMLEKGIQFSSPGNSPKRNFINWFNSHFIKDEPYKYQIELKEKYFNLICEMVLSVAIMSFSNQGNKNDAIEARGKAILERDQLTDLGISFLSSLSKKN